VRHCAHAITAGAPSKRIPCGSSGSSTSITSVTPPRWPSRRALLFLYRHVIGREVGDLGGVIRARKPQRLPVVMTREEVKAVLVNVARDK